MTTDTRASAAGSAAALPAASTARSPTPSTAGLPTASTAASTTESHAVVTHDRWIAARKQLLAREKALTRLGDEVARERRALPWVRIDKDYVFDTPHGPRSLADCFDGRGQLIVQHLMFAPGWENACKSCSFMADHTDPALPHLAQRDVTFIAVSRAPVADIERFKARMGWGFDWVSSQRSDFNFDFNVSFTPEERARGETYYNFGIVSFGAEEMPGVSVFLKDEDGTVYLTYSTYGRGVEVMMHTYRFLDLVPRGRDEEGLEHSMSWVKHHDRYPERAGRVASGATKAAAAAATAVTTTADPTTAAGDCCARG